MICYKWCLKTIRIYIHIINEEGTVGSPSGNKPELTDRHAESLFHIIIVAHDANVLVMLVPNLHLNAFYDTYKIILIFVYAWFPKIIL